MDDFTARCDQARAERRRHEALGASASDTDIAAAFELAGMKSRPQTAPEVPFVEDVYTVNGEGVVVESAVHRWCLASFAPRLLDKVTRGCAEIGWVFTCPKQKTWKPVKRPRPKGPRRVATEHPLFGTYGFLRPEIIDKADWQGLERVDGLGGLVRRPITREPAFLPLGEVEKFMRLEQEGFFDQTRSRPPKVKRKDQVMITSGFFQGKRGFVSLTAGERVKVLLGMLGQVELPVEHVELCA